MSAGRGIFAFAGHSRGMVSRIAGTLGELLITFGVIIALFVFYRLC